MKFILKFYSPFIWTSNRQAWVTQQIISEWYPKHFAIVCYNFVIKTVCLRILLLLDNAPGHPPDLEDIKPLNAELNPICYLLALLGAHYFLHVSRIRVKS